MKKYRTPLPDFANTYTHACNNLASYEVKKNPDPTKKVGTGGDQLAKSGASTLAFAKSKAVYAEKKDHGQTLQELKTFQKPNLDDGNRFYEDNR